MKSFPKLSILLYLSALAAALFLVLKFTKFAQSGGALTGFLDSTTLDTGVVAGAQLNSILWRGSLPGGTSIGFQFATSSNAAGPWNFTGSDGTSGTYYPSNQQLQPGVPYPLPYNFSGIRYFRYRVTLTSDANQTLTPKVTGIIISWSP